MNLYIYKLNLNPKFHDIKSWAAVEHSTLNDHASYLQEGIKNGTVLLVGRTDVQLKDNYGIAVFEAENDLKAQEFMNGDPAVKNGVMSAEVLPFKILKVTDEAKNWNIW